ncbi:HEPN domain-containing protein [Desulforhopalus singaporensis]|uniref:HEPN domain-containing protein n=2 Tax=Desulforhopalus singaporensis TaxID=91360 RepID=A0A1H0Q607_9BACT|nr:HEPN domain-containing protein [Desulforhopalus singaporensis]
MNIVQIDNWQEYLRDGEQFLGTADRALIKRSEIFTPVILYNIACMGIEKLIMAFLMKHGDLAENHTMEDLAYALKKHINLSESFAEKLQFLDKFQEICDLDSYVTHPLTRDDAIKILAIGREVRNLLLPLLT